ncbi:YebC/PmpR family DNA-binding transcriptional regulator [Candidatus Gottesmanbacteria bacterium]|nr:YebC/PmpR family DNA-binding transcriptional regulator [Candidatus Gottesmanbacteria bacterium]
MSGHSKWSKVKHQKAVSDAVKGKLFTKAAHAIAIAIREGGGVGDPVGNFKLRLAIEKARAVNMPKEHIDRAIARAIGQGGEALERITYEGYGPGGTALLIETATDNRQRTVSIIRNMLSAHGGGLGSPGSAQYAFEESGDGYRAKIVIPVSDDQREKLSAMVDALEAFDDVLRVFVNV